MSVRKLTPHCDARRTLPACRECTSGAACPRCAKGEPTPATTAASALPGLASLSLDRLSSRAAPTMVAPYERTNAMPAKYVSEVMRRIVAKIADWRNNPQGSNHWQYGPVPNSNAVYELSWYRFDNEAGDLPAALLTVSESPKFFSNGIDPTGSYGKQIGLEPPSEVDQLEGIILGMPGFIRPLQLPIPTIAAVSSVPLSVRPAPGLYL